MPRSRSRLVCRLPAPLAPGVVLALLVPFALLGPVGCGRAPDAVERFGRGVLNGQVRLAPGAVLPAYARADLARVPLHPDHRPAPPQCADANERARHPGHVTADGLLSGIVVAASDFTHAALADTRKPLRHRVAIRGCRLEPAVIAARAGDWLEIANEDAFAFAPLLGPARRVDPLAKGAHIGVPLLGGRVDALLCTPDAPCGRSDIVVFHHPIFAVTDAHGRFRIPDFPDSELVRVTAWHPLFEASENFTWVERGGSASLELLMTPKERFVPR